MEKAPSLSPQVSILWLSPQASILEMKVCPSRDWTQSPVINMDCRWSKQLCVCLPVGMNPVHCRWGVQCALCAARKKQWCAFSLSFSNLDFSSVCVNSETKLHRISGVAPTLGYMLRVQKANEIQVDSFSPASDCRSGATEQPFPQPLGRQNAFASTDFSRWNYT